MTILIVGASGATGRLLVSQLLERGHHVKIVVRSPDKLPESVRNQDRLSVIRESILDLSDAAMAEHVRSCDAVASCLGHTPNLKGIYGRPRRLVTDTVRRLCDAIKVNTPERPVKYILMNTAGNRNRDLPEPRSFAERSIIALLRLALPPHVDNEQAAEYMRTEIGQSDKTIEWCVIRPDTLIDLDHVTTYAVHPSPTRSAIFNAGKTSRINVAHFMVDLISDDGIWKKWKGKMPVIYNVQT